MSMQSFDNDPRPLELALKAFVEIAEAWSLTTQEQLSILGLSTGEGHASWDANIVGGLPTHVLSMGGFEPGRQVTVEFTVGFVTGDEAWTTLDVRNARHRRVVLEAIPESGMDYGNKPYITVNY